VKTSDRGIGLIEEFEGFSPTMYLDPVGLPTIGFGTLIDTKEEEYLLTAVINREEAETLLMAELIPIEREIEKMVKKVNQNQFDSLVSFCYNLGSGSLKRSTLLKKINLNPDDPTIRKEFDRWVHAGGMILTGLVRRRKAEADLYFTPIPTTE
jgi:lysozyme